MQDKNKNSVRTMAYPGTVIITDIKIEIKNVYAA